MANFQSIVRENQLELIECTGVSLELCLHLDSSKLVTGTDYEELKKLAVNILQATLQPFCNAKNIVIIRTTSNREKPPYICIIMLSKGSMRRHPQNSLKTCVAPKILELTKYCLPKNLVSDAFLFCI